MINQETEMMEYKNILFVALALLLVLPMASAVQGDMYKIYPDRVLINQEEVGNPDIWIDNYHTDSNGNKVYHIDALRDLYVDDENETNNERVLLYLPYKIQPDYIKHINHVGEHVATYFPTNENWEWEYECNSDVEDCSDYEGNVILRVDKIDEGLGSNTFPIGITGPTWAQEGQQYGEFNGVSSNVRIENSDSLNITGTTNLTMVSWIYVTEEVQADNAYVYRMANGDNYGIHASNGDRGITGSVRNSSLNYFSSPSFEPSLNTWYFVVITINQSAISLYRNSEFIGKNSFSGDIRPIDDNDALMIGSEDYTANYFNGSIDEVLIYNRSLSQSEITTLFNQYEVTSTGVDRTGTPSTTGLVLDINFDDYSVADKSGNGNDGTNTNVSFGVVENVLITLTAITDYTISKTTGLFTIVNNDYSWSQLFANWNYIVDNPDYNLAGEAAAGLGEFGEWFDIIVLVGIAGVILLLIFLAFGRSNGIDIGGSY